MAAERIVWNSQMVSDQLAGLRITLTRRLEDAASQLRLAQGMLLAQNVPQVYLRDLHAKMQELERIRERTQVLWRRVQAAQELFDQTESQVTALVMALMQGGDSLHFHAPTGIVHPFPDGIPYVDVLRPRVRLHDRAFYVRPIPAFAEPIRRPVDTHSPPPQHLPIAYRRIEAADLLRGRTLIDNGSEMTEWTATYHLTAPWLAELLAKKTNS